MKRIFVVKNDERGTKFRFLHNEIKSLFKGECGMTYLKLKRKVRREVKLIF
jgi:hypothetical protein